MSDEIAAVEASSQAPKISVIFPMYNCEAYAPQLLESFARQTFADFEAICVIDGATDRTEEIVAGFCAQDPRFRYVTQANAGAGAARNTGLGQARGKYLIWLDADDTYSDDLLSTLYAAAHKHDAEIVMYLYEKQDQRFAGNSVIEGFSRNAFQEGQVYAGTDNPSLFSMIGPRVTNKLYSAAFVAAHGLRFSQSRVSNDTFFNYASVAVAERIVAVHEFLQVFRVHLNPNSLTSARVRYLEDMPAAQLELYVWLDEHGLAEHYRLGYCRKFLSALSFGFGYAINCAFLKENARILNAEEPWKSMTSAEILELNHEPFYARIAARFLAEKDILAASVGSERSAYIQTKETESRNKVHAARILRRLSKDLYGRDFDVPDSLPRGDFRTA